MGQNKLKKDVFDLTIDFPKYLLSLKVEKKGCFFLFIIGFIIRN